MNTSLATKQSQLPSNPIITRDHLIAISKDTHIAAMKNSLMSSKFAMQLEIAVGLAVFAESGRTDRHSKRDLFDVYVAAGFDAADSTGSEYKTVSRRVNAMAGLYECVGEETVREWIGGGAEMLVINSIAQQVASLNLKSIDGVLTYIGKGRLPAPQKTHAELLGGTSNLIEGDNHIREIASNESASDEPIAEGEDWPFKTAEQKAEEAIKQAQAYVADKQSLETAPEALKASTEKAPENTITAGEIVESEGVKHIKTEHLDISIPLAATKKDLTDAINALMAMIAAMDAPEENIIKEDAPVIEAAAPIEQEPEEDMPTNLSHESAPLSFEAPTIRPDIASRLFKSNRFKKNS